MKRSGRRTDDRSGATPSGGDGDRAKGAKDHTEATTNASRSSTTDAKAGGPPLGGNVADDTSGVASTSRRQPGDSQLGLRARVTLAFTLGALVLSGIIGAATLNL
ncbi:hypothetical protein, partial [Candidatus Neomicrothrix sp.]|uniref:hypothetical protein n=1 Tax=Candidatus Neomicrothrix sp. TaxID=2719034 RepID=UPI00259867AA